MTKGKIIELLKLINAQHITPERGEWVMCSCLFAPWKHYRGTDNHPSFGIKSGKSSTFSCFSCGVSGRLHTLFTDLMFFSGKSYQQEREFISDNEGIIEAGDDYEAERDENTILQLIPKSMYHQFPLMKPFKHITQTEILEWDIRYDSKGAYALFPIHDQNQRLVGIHGRRLTDNEILPRFKSYTHLLEGQIDPKTVGVWFGMRLPLIKGKYLVLVEGERDLILLRRSGIKNIWASMGAQLSKPQIKTLKNNPLPKLIVMDDDPAGWQARDKIIAECRGLTPLFVIRNYQGCKDGAEMIEKGVWKNALATIDKC